MIRLNRRKPKRPHTPAKKSKKSIRNEGVNFKSLAQFRYRLRVFVAFADASAKSAGLTSQQYQALLTIKGLSSQKAMYVGELARLLLVKHHSVVELVDRLAKLKLLRRSVDAKDNRRVLVTLTAKGHRLVQKVAEINFKRLGSSNLKLSKMQKLLN